jgi:hypothetical protein
VLLLHASATAYHFLNSRRNAAANQIAYVRKELGREETAGVKEAKVLESHASFDGRRHVEDAILAFGQRQLLDAFPCGGLVVVDTRVEQHVGVPPALLSSELHAFEIVVVDLAHVIAAKALRLQLVILMHLALAHFAIVKLVPLLEAILVSKMDENERSDVCGIWKTCGILGI